jgi:plasmid stabilization system protein ParE
MSEGDPIFHQRSFTPQSFGKRRAPPLPVLPPLSGNPIALWAAQFGESIQSQLERLTYWADRCREAIETELEHLIYRAGGFWESIQPQLKWLKYRADRSWQSIQPRLERWAARPSREGRKEPIHPALRSLAHEARAIFVRLLAYAAGIAVLAVMAAELLRTEPVVAAVQPTPRSEWIAVGKPYPAFALTLPDLGEEAHYAIRRHAQGGGRKDNITFGEPGRSLRYVMIEIYRPGTELERFGDAASEITARAGSLRPAGPARAGLPLDTKFGSASTVEFAVGRFGIGHCIGFVRAFDAPRVQIAGLSCSMNSIVNRNAVVCALDRLTLLSAGSDPDIGKLFANAELKRTFCRQRETLMSATPKREYTLTQAPLRLRGHL